MSDGKVFRGTAIGGPLAGKVIAHNGPYYRAISEKPEPICSHHDGHLPCKETVKVVEYFFNSLGNWQLTQLDIGAANNV